MRKTWIKLVQRIQNTKIIFEILLIFCAGLISQVWFKKDSLLIGVDTFIPINLKNFLNEYFYIWSWKSGVGFSDINKLPFLFPLGFFLKLYEISPLPFSPIIFQRLLTYLLLTGSGFSAYYLFKACFPEASSFSRLLVAFLYIFNFYTMFIFFALPYPLLFSFAFFPFVFSLYVRWVENRKSLIYPIALALAWTILLTPSYMTPPYLLIHFFILLIYSAFRVLLDDKEKREQILTLVRFNGIFLVLWVLVNSFWLLPLVFAFKKQLSAFSVPGASSVELFSLNSAPILDAFRLRGYFGFTSSYKDSPFYLWFKLYENPLFEILSFITPILAFSLLLLKNKNKNKLFFISFTLLFIFLVKGINPPFGFFNKLIFFFPPLTVIFRSVYQRFTGYISLGMALLVGCAFDGLSKTKYFKRKKIKLTFFLSFLILICGIYVLPIWNGKLFSTEGSIAPSMHVRIPPYYFEVAKWFDDQELNFNVFLLPFNRLGLYVESWNEGKDGHGGVSIFPFFSKTRFIYGDLGIELGSKLASHLVQEDVKKASFLAPFNVKYVLVKNDTHWEYIKDNFFWIGDDQKLINRTLPSILGIRKIRPFEKLDLYEVDSDYFLPHFYIPQKIIYSQSRIENLIDIASFEDYVVRSGIYSAAKVLKIGEEIFVKAELEKTIDEKWFEEREEAIAKANEPLPYVKHQPGSLGWKSARLKEKYHEWTLRRDPKRLIDEKLFYASKRISEFEKWGRETEAEYLILNAYQEKMEEVLEEIGKTKSGELKRSMVIKIRVYWERHKEKVEAIWRLGDWEIKKLERWWRMFEELDKKIKLLEKKADLRNLEYSFEIPRKEEYSLFIKEIEGLNNFKVEINGATYIGVEVLPRQNGWINLDKRNFEEGDYRLNLYLRELENLVEDDWQELKELEIKEEGVKFFPQEFFPQGRNIISQPIKNWQGNNFYYLSFDYKTERGGLGLGVLEERSEFQEETVKTKKILGKILKNREGKDWEKFEIVLRANSEALGAKIYFYALADPYQFAKVDFKNVRVERIIQPTVVLRNTQPQVSSYKRSAPEITFVKINPTKYRVKVENAKGSYSLVFSENFHEDWRVYVQTSNFKPETYGNVIASYFDGEIEEGTHKDIFLNRGTIETWGKKPIPEERHFLANGYANSWDITPEDSRGEENYEIIIEFWPQRLFYIGLGISLITFLGCLGYLGQSFMKRRIGVKNEEN